MCLFLILGEFVSLICLPGKDDKINLLSKCMTAGWGITEPYREYIPCLFPDLNPNKYLWSLSVLFAHFQFLCIFSRNDSRKSLFHNGSKGDYLGFRTSYSIILVHWYEFTDTCKNLCCRISSDFFYLTNICMWFLPNKYLYVITPQLHSEHTHLLSQQYRCCYGEKLFLRLWADFQRWEAFTEMIGWYNWLSLSENNLHKGQTHESGLTSTTFYNWINKLHTSNKIKSKSECNFGCHLQCQHLNVKSSQKNKSTVKPMKSRLNTWNMKCIVCFNSNWFGCTLPSFYIMVSFFYLLRTVLKTKEPT